jgi:hypothetical protein
MTNLDALNARAKALNLRGLLAHWSEAGTADWVQTLIDWEEQERARRSLERRLRAPPHTASSRSPTSTGLGPSAATAPPSKP